jgi:hypothetical protein
MSYDLVYYERQVVSLLLSSCSGIQMNSVILNLTAVNRTYYTVFNEMVLDANSNVGDLSNSIRIDSIIDCLNSGPSQDTGILMWIGALSSTC